MLVMQLRDSRRSRKVTSVGNVLLSTTNSDAHLCRRDHRLASHVSCEKRTRGITISGWSICGIIWFITSSLIPSTKYVVCGAGHNLSVSIVVVVPAYSSMNKVSPHQ